MAKPKEMPPDILKDMLDTAKGKSKEPRLSDVAQYFFQLAGGAKGVAVLMFNELKKDNTPAFVRARIIDVVLRATKYANDKQQTEDVDLMDDDDLDKEITELLRELTSAEQQETNPAGPGEHSGRSGEQEAPGPERPQGVLNPADSGTAQEHLSSGDDPSSQTHP